MGPSGRLARVTASDANGNLYVQTGNGTFDTTLTPSGFPSKNDYGNAIVKMSTGGGSLAVADYFTMFNTTSETASDADLGSGGDCGVVSPSTMRSQCCVAPKCATARARAISLPDAVCR